MYKYSCYMARLPVPNSHITCCTITTRPSPAAYLSVVNFCHIYSLFPSCCFAFLTNTILKLDLKEIASMIESGANTSEVRKIYKAMRLTMKLRRKLKVSMLSAFLNYALGHVSEVHAQLSSYVPQVN